MPLGDRGGDKSEARFCGVETEFSDDMPNVITFNLSTGKFDFVVAPLILSPEMSLATVRAYIWKRTDDLALHYRVIHGR